MDQTEALIIETIDRHREEILEFARDIYSHAELGYKEFQTSGKFVKKMEQLGLRTEKGFAITGVKAYLNEDKKENASLALLGELDALRIQCGTLLWTSCTDGRRVRGCTCTDGS